MCVLAVAVSPVQRCLRESLSVIKLTKREIAWQREGQIAAAINYQVENLPAGHTAYVIKVQNEWRVICSENGVESEWEDRYVSADAALEALEGPG